MLDSHAHHSTVKKGIEALFKAIGENPAREGLLKTPDRFLKAYLEMTEGYREDPAHILSTQFDIEGDGGVIYDEMILCLKIPIVSLCEHHLLPFTGYAHMGYVPDKKIVGLSKMARLVHCFAKRLQVQERLTAQIGDTFQNILEPVGCGVIIEAHHSCMSCRGSKVSGALMATSHLTGIFKENKSTRQEFFSLVRS